MLGYCVAVSGQVALLITKRPHDASCLSVVSFISTKCRAQSFIVSYISYRLNHYVQLNAVLLSLA